MKKLSLCLLVAIAFVGCNKPPSEDADSKSDSSSEATPRVAKKSSPTPKPNDWMWKTSDGKARNTDPLKVSDNPLEQKTKK